MKVAVISSSGNVGKTDRPLQDWLRPLGSAALKGSYCRKRTSASEEDGCPLRASAITSGRCRTTPS